jgi:hypothetical protein
MLMFLVRIIFYFLMNCARRAVQCVMGVCNYGTMTLQVDSLVSLVIRRRKKIESLLCQQRAATPAGGAGRRVEHTRIL